LQTSAASLPAPASRASDAELLDAALKLAPWLVPFVGGGLWRTWTRRRARRALERELLEAMAEQCRASADFDRFQIRYLIGRETEALLPAEAREQYEAIKARVRETRRRLWKARGYPESSPDVEMTETERAILRELRQTRRWQMRDQVERDKPKDGDPGEIIFRAGEDEQR
jgi:hypothetical protein